MRLDKYLTYESLLIQADGPTDMKDEDRSSRKTEGHDSGKHWDNGLGYTRSLALATTGDIEGARSLSRAILQGANQFRMSMGRLDPEYRVEEGHWINVDRFVRGEPEVWGTMVATNERTAKKSISLVINVAVSWNVTAKQIDTVAVNLGSKILGLQSAGYTVMVYLSTVNKTNSPWVISAPVNYNGGTLDISRLSAVLRPWFFRRVIFSLWETADKEQREKHRIKMGDGYGQIGKLTDEMLKKITGDNNALAIDIDNYLRDTDGKFLERDIINALKKG